MPFKSEKQRKLMWAKANRGEIDKSKVKEWEKKTKRPLPEKVGYYNIDMPSLRDLGRVSALETLGLSKNAFVGSVMNVARSGAAKAKPAVEAAVNKVKGMSTKNKALAAGGAGAAAGGAAGLAAGPRGNQPPPQT